MIIFDIQSLLSEFILDQNTYSLAVFDLIAENESETIKKFRV